MLLFPSDPKTLKPIDDLKARPPLFPSDPKTLKPIDDLKARPPCCCSPLTLKP